MGYAESAAYPEQLPATGPYLCLSVSLQLLTAADDVPREAKLLLPG